MISGMGKTPQIYSGSCGPTALSYLLGKDPKQLTDTAIQNKLSYSDGATTPEQQVQIAQKNGKKAAEVSGLTKIWQYLKRGYKMVLNLPNGISGIAGSTQPGRGHAVAATGITQDGNIQVIDPTDGKTKKLSLAKLQQQPQTKAVVLA